MALAVGGSMPSNAVPSEDVDPPRSLDGHEQGKSDSTGVGRLRIFQLLTFIAKDSARCVRCKRRCGRRRDARRGEADEDGEAQRCSTELAKSKDQELEEGGSAMVLATSCRVEDDCRESSDTTCGSSGEGEPTLSSESTATGWQREVSGPSDSEISLHMRDHLQMLSDPAWSSAQPPELAPRGANSSWELGPDVQAKPTPSTDPMSEVFSCLSSTPSEWSHKHEDIPCHPALSGPQCTELDALNAQGYACSPRERLAHLIKFNAVEGLVDDRFAEWCQCEPAPPKVILARGAVALSKIGDLNEAPREVSRCPSNVYSEWSATSYGATKHHLDPDRGACQIFEEKPHIHSSVSPVVPQADNIEPPPPPPELPKDDSEELAPPPPESRKEQLLLGDHRPTTPRVWRLRVSL